MPARTSSAFSTNRWKPIATGLGRYDLDRCNRLDEDLPVVRRPRLQSVGTWCFTRFISEDVWGGDSQYRNNPYRTLASAKDFFGSDEAWRYQEKLYRYVIARWGYSRACSCGL